MKRASWYMVVLLSRPPSPIKCVPGQTYRSGRLTLGRGTLLSSTAGLASAFERLLDKYESVIASLTSSRSIALRSLGKGPR